jgi:hypothetical protein
MGARIESAWLPAPQSTRTLATARLLPFSVDFLIVAGSVILLAVRSPRKGQVPTAGQSALLWSGKDATPPPLGVPSGGPRTVSELAVENAPDVAAPAHEAANGQVIYITEGGNRVAAVVPAEAGAILEQLSADELDELATAAEQAGLPVARLIEDLADRAAVLESRADPGPGISWDNLKAETGM